MGPIILQRRASLRAHAEPLFKNSKTAAKLNGSLYKVDREKCTLLRGCERGCPVANIEIKDGKVNFIKHCCNVYVLRHVLPQDAISIGLLKYWKVNGPKPLYRLTETNLSLPFNYS